MIYQLHIKFIPISQFDLNADDQKKMILGRIHIFVASMSGTKIQDVIDMLGDFKELTSWIKINRKALLNASLPFGMLNSSSIAETIAQFYENVRDDTDDKTLKYVYEYRKSHGLRFGLRGTDAPDIYIGLFDGAHQISLCEKSKKWNYNIDLQAFLDEMEIHYNSFK